MGDWGDKGLRETSAFSIVYHADVRAIPSTSSLCRRNIAELIDSLQHCFESLLYNKIENAGSRRNENCLFRLRGLLDDVFLCSKGTDATHLL